MFQEGVIRNQRDCTFSVIKCMAVENCQDMLKCDRNEERIKMIASLNKKEKQYELRRLRIEGIYR